MQIVDSSVSSARFPVTLDIPGFAGDLSSSGAAVTFTPTAVGELQVKCRATDGSVADANGVTVMVTPGPAASWTFTPPATEACFGQTDTLSIDGEVFDSFGNALSGRLIVTIEPSTNVIGSPNTGYRFLADGQYEVTVAVEGEKAVDHNITSEVFTVSVDATAPVFELVSPARGEMLQVGGTEDYELTVVGSVRDEATPLVAVTLDGKDIAVDGDSVEVTLDTTTMSRWGMSVLAGTAQDACGNIAYLAVPYMRSTQYYPAAVTANASATVTEALAGQVSQSFVDDGDRTDVDDFTTIAQNAMDSFNFNTMLLPGEELSRKEFTESCTGDPTDNWIEVAYIAARHPDPSRILSLNPYVDAMDFYAGAVGLSAGVTNFNFPLQIGVTIVQCAVGIPAVDSFVVDATVGLNRLAFDGIIGVDLANGRVAASIEALSFGVSGPFLDLDCGSFDWACDTFSGLVMGAAESMVSPVVETAITEMVPPLLETGLSGFGIAGAIELPAPLSATLNVAANLERITFCGPSTGAPIPAACHVDNSAPGSMGLALGTQFYPSARGPEIPVSARGAIKSNASAPQFSSSTASFGVGMRTDAINQLFWALWYAGTFDIARLSPGFRGSRRALAPTADSRSSACRTPATAAC